MNEKMEKRGKSRAVLALLVLAPICGEMLSGSEPPMNWLNPAVWLLIFMYGSGALLIRELIHRWGKGWPSIFLLGMAYGIFEEGLVVRSFFSPDWPDLHVLAWYGRALGVNWVWTINLTWFHAVISILIPIMIVERFLYPEVKDIPWLKKRGMVMHSFLLLAWIPLGIFVIGMPAPPLALLLSVAVIGLLALLARTWKQRGPIPANVQTPPSPRVIWLFGFASMVGLILTMWIVPNTGAPAWLGITASLFLPLVLIWIAHRLKVRSWKPRQQWAYTAGSLWVWILIALFLQESRDMVIIGIGFVLFLWMLKRWVWNKTRLTQESFEKDSLSEMLFDPHSLEEGIK